MPTMTVTPTLAHQCPALHWEVFCRVIDNHGDLGVCWRLARQLALLGHTVRLWVDDASALAWMAPGGQAGVQVLPWAAQSNADETGPIAPERVWVEAFGCVPEYKFIANNLTNISDRRQNSHKNVVWINLEYLSAEPYAEACHGLPSPVMHGPGAGLTKLFYYPGFTPRCGGLLREPELAQRQAHFDRTAWLAGQGIAWSGQRVVSLFCYEPAALPALLQQWAADPTPTLLLVTPGRAQAAVRAAMAQARAARPKNQDHRATPTHLTVHELPHLSQNDFDHLLWACDINLVRGEDSLVRALWAGKPFVWHIYPQDDGAHWPKLDAFLDWLQAPPALRALHQAWNASAPPPGRPNTPFAALAAMDWQAALTCTQAAKQRLLMQPDLVTQLQSKVIQARRTD